LRTIVIDFHPPNSITWCNVAPSRTAQLARIGKYRVYTATMSVHSHAFGSVRLTGEDARKFKAQVAYGRQNKAAVASIERGRPAAATLVRKGYAPIKIKAR
jgi:hypothetical protein